MTKIKKNIAVSNTGFLFNPMTGDSFSVNPIGQEIIRYFQEGKSEEEILKNIMEQYRVDESTAEKDLLDFKKMLLYYKLID